ncbi:hypothetical protein NMY22_g10453 [Coprinellus aureogranulatus]|nr:hypothetical protein NMY22_g10453 [Coprinellus aureogranulatus]
MIHSRVLRTGDRDERVPLEKFVSMVEEIFEMEDTLGTDISPADLPEDYFSHLSHDVSRPMLSTALIRKLSKYIAQAARPGKRSRQASAGGTATFATPRSRNGRMAEVNVQLLSRLLKILDRSVKAAEDLDPFPASSSSSTLNGAASAKSSPVKKSRKKKAKESDDQEMDDGEDESNRNTKEGSPAGVGDFELDKLSRNLAIAIDSILAADCCIALLNSDRLPKQLYSEELITGCLNTIKNRLTKILYPFVEACSPEAVNNKFLGVNPLLAHVIKSGSSAEHRQQMFELFQALSGVLSKINSLVNAESVAMSDSIIIQTVYIAIGPFFVVEPGTENDSSSKSGRKEKERERDSILYKTLGKTPMKILRLEALSLIRSIFANHDDQRSWIIEEILTSLIKLSDTKQKAGQFRLRDGRSIRTVSALLLQLVQTSAHDVRLGARAIEKKRQATFALKRQESFSESQGKQESDEPFLDEIDTEEIRLYGSGLESATKAAWTIIVFLNSRSGKGKATKNSNEAEYRAIFDNLMEDLLAVLYWPEWPAAALLLSMASRFMVNALGDDKSAHADSNAAKTMALDHLGVIAARIRTSTLKVQKAVKDEESKFIGLKPLDEIVASRSIKEFTKVIDAHREVAAHLVKRSTQDQAYESARELTAASLCQELAACLKQVNVHLDHPDEDDDLNLRGRKDQDKLLAFGEKLKSALREVWKDPATDVFDIGSQEEASRIDRLAEEIGTIQAMKISFQTILNVIVTSLNAPVIFMRTKALRALGQIIMSDATILSVPSVRKGIEGHLLDNSPAVRDAAVELIGKYMIDSPEVAGDYYQKIAERMADTGLSVRKRVIKLLKSFYSVTTDNVIKIDICKGLVMRLQDEDDTVKELAIKTLEELWFPPPPLQSAMKKPNTQNNQDKGALLTKVSVIMGTAAIFADRNHPLEEVLHKVMSGKEGNEAANLHARYTEICEALIDGLVDASDLPGFTIINCIRTIYFLSAAYPPVLSGQKASTLLPYLKNATTPEEIQTSDYLLKTFRVSVSHMPKTAAKFGQELQSTLQPMIIKPANGVLILQEAVACMCAVVAHLTHNYLLLINLLKSCNMRVVGILRMPTPPSDTRPLLMLIFIVSLLAEHCNFDQLRKDHEDLAPEIDAISTGSIMEHVYLTMLRIYHKFESPALRTRVLQCLGFLFRAQPTLMTQEPSAEIMDAIFNSDDEEGHCRLLKIMQNFLVSESEKHSAKEKESSKSKTKAGDVNMEELVGNTDGFADSGVSSAIVQRYLQKILDAALHTNTIIQSAALDVLTFTIKQGLAHPLQSFPVIIALETSNAPLISGRAAALHAIVNSKHASLVNTRYSISARKAFDYQKKISSEAVKGYRPTTPPIAHLQRWYSFVREKRQVRQEFLKALVRVFQENENFEASQDDVDFTRYMAENFATFEYKTQEEVFVVIKFLTTALSTTGVQLLEIVSPSHLLSHLHHAPPPPPSATPSLASIPGDLASVPMDVDPSSQGSSSQPQSQSQSQSYGGRDPIPLMRSSVIVAMIMLLKAHLKALYSLSEDKCNKFVIGKKSAIGDKPTVKRHENPISWDRLPYAVNPIHTSHDAAAQKATFLEIWNEDGVSAEPEDEEML